MILTQEHVGKLTRIAGPVQVPAHMPQGSLIMLFNDTDQEIPVRAQGTMYVSGRARGQSNVLLRPRSLANVFFVGPEESVLTGEVA